MLTNLSHQVILALTVGLAALHQPDQLTTHLGVVAVGVVVLDLVYGVRSYRQGRTPAPEQKSPAVDAEMR
jgi:hypothetical protein